MALLDVVNEHDQIIGSASYEEIKKNHLNHRGVCTLVFDANDRLYLQRRALQHVSSPGLWDMSSSGHVDLGESYEAAAERELEEELGIRDVKIRFLTNYYVSEHSPVFGAVNGFVGLFEAKTNGQTIVPNQLELMEGKWVTISELEAWLTQSPQDFTEGARFAYQKYKEATK